ncbi:MAG: CHASE domain-containing protein [Magnetococcales bacterium]|nr:CHASE domain-containing protein [Magnetococcales bacterium]
MTTSPLPFLPGRDWIFLASGWLFSKVTGWIVLIFSVIITILAWHTSNLFMERRAHDRFEFKVEEAHRSILKRMLEYEQVLRGGVGLFNASDEVTRQDWHHYVTTLKIETYWPGIQGIGFSLMIPPEGRDVVERQIRSEGFDSFAIRPEGKRDQYSAILYLEPFSGRNLRAFGYDMWSESVRRAAMKQALESGQAALSGRVTLVQETDRDVQAGFLMYLPVYRAGMATLTLEERRAAILGFVYSPFRIRDLMEGILGHGDPDLDFDLFDGESPEAANRLYSTYGSGAGAVSTPPRYTRTSRMELPGGRIWLARFFSRPVFEKELESHQSLIIALLGMLVDLLLFGIVWSLSGQKERIQLQAQRIAMDLNQAELRYRKMVEGVRDVIFQTDIQGRWSFLNPAWEAVSGYAVAESLGRPFLHHVHPEDQSRALERFEKLIRGELHFFQEEYRGIHRSGDSVWVEVYVSVLSDEQGMPIGSSGILRDITMRKEIDAMMVRARDAAESANRAKSEFLANMSHELRSPLNSLLILSKLLAQDGNLTPEQVESARVIHQSGEDLLALINDILDLSKVEAGRMEAVAESLDVARFCRGVMEPFQAIARSRGLTLELELAADLPTEFCTDGGKFKQILGNLLSNALKFTEQGRVRVQVESMAAHPALPDSVAPLLCLRVVDTGIGIPEEMQEAIFENFRQIDGAASRKYGGTGLGLAIARKLAALLNGVIQVKSRPGEGSVFTLLLAELAHSPVPVTGKRAEDEKSAVSLPTLRAEGVPEASVAGAFPVPVQSSLLVHGAPVTLLVVDDDMRVAFSIASALQSRVEAVLLAANGAKALKQLEQHPEVQVIIMDIRMPELDGFETMRAIRADDRFRGVAILALTAMALPGTEEQCLAAGADGYLVKPASIEAIWEKLGQILAKLAGSDGSEVA